MAQRVISQTTCSPEETHDFGIRLGGDLRPGDCVALYGDLGSGKTCLAQGICEGMRVTDAVTSPTFILINEYAGLDASGALMPVYHFDLYRLEGADELFDLGCDDYFYGPGVCLIEWAERGEDALPAGAIHIRIDPTGETSRRFTITYPE